MSFSSFQYGLRFYLWLARISVLCDKIAGITRQHIIIYLALSTFAQVYHFANVGKMIGYFLTSIRTSRLSFFNDIPKVSPLNITQ